MTIKCTHQNCPPAFLKRGVVSMPTDRSELLEWYGLPYIYINIFDGWY